jgi:single-strand DNA-binding protein
MNKAQLIGHVGKDPEIRTMQGGGKVASFSVATTETWKDKKTGDRKEKTEWHRVVVFSPGLAGVIEKYVKKGAKLYVEGQLATRKWTDKKGVDHYATEIVIKSFGGTIELLDRKPATPAEPSSTDEAPIDETYAGDLEDEIAF